MTTKTKAQMTNSNRGAVLVFIVLISVVLFLMMALAIDTARLGNAQQKYSRVAELTALAAVEAYTSFQPLSTLPVEQHSERLVDAIGRAHQLLSSDRNILAERTINLSSNPHLIDSSSSFDGSDPSTWQLKELTTNVGTDDFGTIEAGEWFYEDPGCGTATFSGPNVQNCPCNAGNAWVAPCFRPNPSGSTGASAFRVTLHTDESNPFETTFAQLSGQNSIPINAQAVAALVPRNAAFLVDLSGSAVEDSHRIPAGTDFNVASTPAGELSYAAYPVAACPWDGSDILSNVSPRPYASWFGINPTSGTNLAYPGLPSTRPGWSGGTENAAFVAAVTGLRPESIHYRDDYSCFGLDTDGSPGQDEFYLVASEHLPRTLCKVFNSGTGQCTAASPEPYWGPQPLVSILESINSAINTMAQFAVRGDSVMVLGFDGGILPSREFGPTGLDQPEFNQIQTLTNVRNQASITARNNAGFFPRVPGHTDLQRALLHARTKLSELPNASWADSWIALFSDGMMTCSHASGSTLLIPNGTNSFNWAVDDNCGSAVATHNSGINELKALLRGTSGTGLTLPSQYWTFAKSKFKVHTFLFGKAVQPHTLVKKMGTRCMTDAEARLNNNTAFTQGTVSTSTDSTQGPYPGTASAPYLNPNKYLYEDVSRSTGARFAPIRVPCDPSLVGLTQEQCENGALVARLDTACSNRGGSNGSLLSESYDTIVDAYVINGRLICDPLCRTTESQISFELQALFQDNPFMLVD